MEFASSVKRCAFSIAVVALAGCGGLQSQSVTRNPVPQVPTAEHGQSWMLPEAKSRDLMYVAGSYGAVYIFLLPRGKQVGYLTGFSATYGLCSDHAGNVWIPDYGSSSGSVFEYPHGASVPVEKLSVPGVHPIACSVDPLTGNLAVVGPSAFTKNSGVIAIFGSTTSPQSYSVPFNPQNCAYDGSGNLFVDGYTNGGPQLVFSFGELGRGDSMFQSLSPEPKLRYAAPIQWDGQYLALGNVGHIDRFLVQGQRLSRVGRVSLSKIAGAVVGLWIDGDNLAATNGAPAHGINASIQIYRYPAGGHPLRTVREVKAHHIPFAAQGVTVSVAPHRSP